MSLSVDGEVKLDTDPCLLVWAGAIYAGTEDGSIKSFSASLQPGVAWRAHEAQLFALDAGGGCLYSASNDGNVRVWSARAAPAAPGATVAAPRPLCELPCEADVCALHCAGDELYVGDESGGVTVFEKNAVKACYNVLEEVKEILVCRPFMLTVRSLDVTVTEIKPDTSKTRFVTRHTMEGRAPMRLGGVGGGGALLLLMSRDGMYLRVHDNSADTQYRLLHEARASEMIVTSLAIGDGGGTAWSAGWDGRVRRWRLGEPGASALTPAGDIELGACVNALVCSEEPGVVYAAVAGGRIVRVRAQ